MIEEILTEPTGSGKAANGGELLKFGVHALLNSRPYHGHLGRCKLSRLRYLFSPTLPKRGSQILGFLEIFLCVKPI